MEWSTNYASKYSIQRKGLTVYMRTESCNWNTGMCDQHKQAPLVRSTNSKYSAYGWMEVHDIHNGILNIYLRRVGNALKLAWFRPDGWNITGKGIRGECNCYVDVAF